MQVPPNKIQSEFQGLPDITFRQLEVFRVVLRERSYTNAAIELRSTRANIKRVCEDFEKAVGRPLFEEDADKNLTPSVFAKGIVAQLGTLSRSLRRMGEGVRSLHASGRVVRFAAAGEFFRGGLFTDFLSRLNIKDSFLPCFLRIDLKRYRTALLNNECDIYFGVGLGDCDRLDATDMGPVPWKIRVPTGWEMPRDFSDLANVKWGIVRCGESNVSEGILKTFHHSGAIGGQVFDDEDEAAMSRSIVFKADTGVREPGVCEPPWPCHRFSAVMRKHHPYSELKSRLEEASLA